MDEVAWRPGPIRPARRQRAATANRACSSSGCGPVPSGSSMCCRDGRL